MGVYIVHTHIECKDKKGQWRLPTTEYVCPVEDPYHDNSTDWPFWWQSYDMFAVLCGVRNYSGVRSVKHATGLPADSEYLNEVISADGSFAHLTRQREEEPFCISGYWFYHIVLSDLLSFNYDDKLIDFRDGKKEKTYREFLGDDFFTVVKSLQDFADREVDGDASRLRLIIGFD